MLDEILKLLREISEKLSNLEQRLAFPVVPAYPPAPALPKSPMKCQKCGMIFDGITGYACMTPGCPVFYRVTC